MSPATILLTCVVIRCENLQHKKKRAFRYDPAKTQISMRIPHSWAQDSDQRFCTRTTKTLIRIFAVGIFWLLFSHTEDRVFKSLSVCLSVSLSLCICLSLPLCLSLSLSLSLSHGIVRSFCSYCLHSTLKHWRLKVQGYITTAYICQRISGNSTGHSSDCSRDFFIHFVDFPPYCTRETTFVTSCLLLHTKVLLITGLLPLKETKMLSLGSGPEVIKRFSCWTQQSVKFVLLIILKLLIFANSIWPTIVGIFIFISRENFMLSWVEHAKRFITLGSELHRMSRVAKSKHW